MADRSDKTDRTAAIPSAGVARWQEREPVAIDPVQYKAWCDDKLAAMMAEPVGVQQAAARGVEGPSTALPHHDAIQASFGHHDVSGVQAHVGGAAADASAQMGAQAFATGNHVAFAAQPDLHLAAHEAAHVVQQRGGVQLKGGVGQAGDAYEQHADAVADAVVRGESAAPLLDRMPGQGSAGPAVQRFGAGEHELLGNMGSGGASVTLAPDYTLTYGEMVALAGDHFSSIEQMRIFAANLDGGAGSRLEIEYARKWMLGKNVDWKDGDPKYEAAKKAQEKRYYVLAGGNEEPYKGNASHFLNPREGDEDRSTADKAVDFEKRWDDRTDGKKLGQWVHMDAGVGSSASYRINHVHALAEAWDAGQAKGQVGEALAHDAFGCHYLTDSFSAGHIRTPRRGAKDYWDAKVPMFYENMVGYMASKITEHLVAAEADLEVEVPIEVPWIDTPIPSPGSLWLYPDADHVPKTNVWSGARDKVRKVFESKSKLSLGDVVAGAMHDLDNDTGVRAHVDGKQVRLYGDGEILKGGKVTDHGLETAQLATKAVSLSVFDVHAAHREGTQGTSFEETMTKLFGADRLFAAERLLPTLTKDDRNDPDNPELQWKFATAEELITDARMKSAFALLLTEKAGELTGAGFKGSEQAAINSLATTMQGDPEKLLRDVINWTPNAGAGIDGSADKNARDYYATAKKAKGGLASLTATQRINLAVDCINGTISEADEETVWGLLETASDEQAREVIKHIGWDDLAKYLDGAEDTKFRKRFPKDQYQ